MALSEDLAPFVPSAVVRRATRERRALAGPEAERVPAAVLFADISGFTPLADRLAQQGPRGAERLSELLNDYFGRLVAVVDEHAGEVVKFAGDALLAVWTAADEDLARTTCRAAQCALAMRWRFGGYEASEGSPLALRIAIGAGDVTAMHVGGVDGRWQYLLAGAPLDQIAAAAREARAGDVVLSSEARTLAGYGCTGEPAANGCLRVISVPMALDSRSAPPQPPLPEAASSFVRGYVAEPILSRLAIAGREWLAELRRVTVLFAGLGIDHAGPAALDEAHRTLALAQRVLHRYGGSVKELVVDDKGPTLVAVFGLPALLHEDDAARAVQSALVIRAGMRELGMRAGLGVATGRAFCGIVGGARRREYTVVGDVMNLAARLMEAAGDDVLCDDGTRQAAARRIAFEALASIAVKGRAEPVAIHRPVGERREPAAPRAFVGREAERARLGGHLEAVRGGASQVVVVEGEAGIGKSRLIVDILERAAAAGMQRLVGAAEAIGSSTPYQAWRSIFAQVFEVEDLVDAGSRRVRVLERLERSADLRRLAPLLNAVLSLDLPDNEVTAHMTGPVRAENTREVLAGVLGEHAEPAPLVVVLEDAHWLDSASWALVRLVSERVHPVLIAVATRPLEEPLPPEYAQLLASADTDRIQLGGLPPDDTAALVRDRLGVRSLPDEVATLVVERAEGNPFFSEELAYALRDTGVLVIRDGTSEVAAGVDVRALTFPETVQGVVTSRIDRLTPSQQLALKVASVIGRAFAYGILRNVYPGEDGQRLLEDLEATRRLDLTVLDRPEPDLAYLFKHAITQEVAYTLLLFAQRRQLHRAVAEWYERWRVEDLVPLYPLLAHHWVRAEDDAKALEYLARAGAEAARGGAFQEAIGFFTDALAVLRRVAPADERVRAMHYERQLGEAYYHVGRLADSVEHLRGALALAGWPEPSSHARLVLRLLREALRQTAHRLRPGAIRGPSGSEREALVDAARASERLGEIRIIENDTLGVMNSILVGLNLAEVAGPSPELARQYGNACVVAGIVPWHGLARTYRRLARETAATVNDLPTLAWVPMVAGLYETGIAEWDAARADLARSIEIADSIGAWSQWAESSFILASVEYYRGEFRSSRERFTAILAQGRRRGNVAHQSWGLFGQGQNALRIGHLEEALAFLEDGARLLAERPERTFQISVHGLLAQVRLRRADPDGAHREATTTARLIAASGARPSLHYVLEGYGSSAETFLALWESDPGSTALAKVARTAVRALGAYARVFPIGEPRARLCEGWLTWIEGRAERARRDWERGVAAAERLEMPYEEARLRYEIGRRFSSHGPAARAELERAAEIFARLGAVGGSTSVDAQS